jgi:ribosomal protein S18 acetylase RimI-like enzyme
MQFELDSILLDQILFFMEDQDGDFVLDTHEGLVISTDDFIGDDDPDEDRYISIPEWDSAEGYKLMERFSAGLRNALVREELSAALNRGRGVFRAFKNTLAQYPETEKMWYAYKDREMKRKVIAWYNALRETWGLELIGEEPEDISGLALEDFRFRQGTAADLNCAEELRRACQSGVGTADDAAGGAAGGAAEIAGQDIIPAAVSGLGEWVFPGDICFAVETAGGEFAGYVSAVRLDGALRVCAVEVKPEYRGLGLGKTLIARLLEQADSEKIPNVIIDVPVGLPSGLPFGGEHFARALARESFKPCVQRYCRNIPCNRP